MKVTVEHNGEAIWCRDSESADGMASRGYLTDGTQQKIISALIDALTQANGEIPLHPPLQQISLTVSDEQLKETAEELRKARVSPALYFPQENTVPAEREILDRARGSEKHPVAWILQVGSDDVWFSRVTNGRIDYDYAPVSREKANVYASAILNDLEPPRHLQKSDKPTVQTQSEQRLHPFCLHSENPSR